MANVLSIAYFVVGVTVIHAGLLLWTAVVLPRPVERARLALQDHPVRSFFGGVLFCLVLLAIVSALLLVRLQTVAALDRLLAVAAATLGVTRPYNDAWIATHMLAWLFAAPVLSGFIVGGAAFARIFAARARALMQRDSPLLVLMLGALVTSSSYFLPFAGWFAFLPVVGLMSVGAGVLGIFSWRDPRTRIAEHSPLSRQEAPPELGSPARAAAGREHAR
jgi:hypothetical protein